MNEIPNAVLAMLNEHTSGGYFLVVIDAKRNPVVYFKADDPVCAMAIKSCVDTWSEATSALNLDNAINGIAEIRDEEEDE